ncbi:MAG: hypothetical protein ACOYMH_02865, partial [Zwartia sp.]
SFSANQKPSRENDWAFIFRVANQLGQMLSTKAVSLEPGAPDCHFSQRTESIAYQLGVLGNKGYP